MAFLFTLALMLSCLSVVSVRTRSAKEIRNTAMDQEYTAILNACRKLPLPRGNYHVDDYVMNLISTVLDYQMNPTTLANAENHYKQNRWHTIRTRDDLANFLKQYPNDREGNIEAAVYLWGYKYGNRLQQLRGLLDYFDSIDVRDQDGLRRWAKESNFERDFKGRVKGLAFAVYKWLVMRQGVETIKPDVHVKNFLREVSGRSFSDAEAVSVLERAARELGRLANELDWSIWEHQRNR
jgi:hypothetical protein